MLVADTVEIPCHKAVLAACSPYFYAMFTGELAEARADRIVLQEVDGRALSLLIDFTYTAEVHVTEENVQVSLRWGVWSACARLESFLFVLFFECLPYPSEFPRPLFLL